jgi:hypothetical protein
MLTIIAKYFYRLNKYISKKFNYLCELLFKKKPSDLLLVKIFLSLKKFLFNLGLPDMIHIRFILIVLIVDVCLMDDEPLWEPIEWSMTQSWLLFFFIFAWLVETIITARYGSYTGRDKRVYTGLFKAFWYVEMWFNLNMFLVCMFIIVPFYFELTYTVSYVVTWWTWYNRFFFFKFIVVWLIIDFISSVLLHGIRWLNFKKIFLLCNLITFLLFYLFYIQFTVTYFSYFTDSLWYKKTSWCDFNKLSHNPQKWGWGGYDRDHFSYHKTTINFWFKNDALYASGFFFINMIHFVLLSFTTLQWLLIVRQLYTTQNVSFTFLTFGLSTLSMYFTNVFLLFTFVIISMFYIFIKTSTDFTWIVFKTDINTIIQVSLWF